MKHVMFVYMLLWKLIVIHVVLEKMARCLMSSFKLHPYIYKRIF